MISTSGFKKGIYILFRDKPHRIVSFSFVSPGKGSAFYRTRLKSLETGAVLEYTFKSGEKVEEVNVDTRQLQFLYRDGETARRWALRRHSRAVGRFPKLTPG